MRLGRGRPSTPRVGVRRELAIFYGAAAVALIVVSIGAVVASKSVAKSQALADAERMAGRLGSLVVSPILGDALNGVAGSADQTSVRAISNRMKDGSLKQVTVWDRSGRIVWADDPAVIGTQQDPPPEVLAAIDDGVTSSDFDDQPEATGPDFVASEEGFVEVYTPFDVDGQTLAFEAYYDYARVDDTANGLLFQLIPLVLVPLLVLMLIQVPIAASLARRIRRQDADRSALLERNLSVSEKERVRVAADLHDGPIQELAGVGYALGAVASSVPENKQPLMRDIQNTVLHAIESLRELMVDLYPPDLSVGQLPNTLENLAAPLQGKGIDIDISVTELPAVGQRRGDHDLPGRARGAGQCCRACGRLAGEHPARHERFDGPRSQQDRPPRGHRQRGRAGPVQARSTLGGPSGAAPAQDPGGGPRWHAHPDRRRTGRHGCRGHTSGGWTPRCLTAGMTHRNV